MTTDDKFVNFMRGQGQTRYSFSSLSAWRAHSEFAHSKLSGTYRPAYSPGWEANSTDTKPIMATIDDFPNSRLTGYRPEPTSAVTVAASGSLNGRNWWTTLPTWGDEYFPWDDGAITLAPDAWKGALDPSGSTMPVGVQNP